MQLGIFAKTFSESTPLTVLNAARSAGFMSVQYNMACSGIASLPDAITDSQVAEIAEAVTQSGVAIAAVSATYNMVHPHIETRLSGRAAFELIASKARGMGTSLVTLCTGSLNASNQWETHPDNNSPEAWASMIKEFHAILPIAEAHDIILGIEPEKANIVSSAQCAERLISELGHDRLGIVLDPANLFDAQDVSERTDIVSDAVERLGRYVVMAHAKDRANDGNFMAAGRGCIDFTSFLTALNRQGFDGPLITHGCTADEASSVSVFLKTQLGTGTVEC